MKVLVLHGPNLNLLGEREPEIYGTLTLAEIDERLRARGAELGVEVRTFQSNHEGALIDKLHAERHWMDGLIINAGAYTHTSYAIRDAIAAVNVRAWEVHLSDIQRREPWRRHSVMEDVCVGQISGKGLGSYLEALEHLAAESGLRKERRAAGPADRRAKRDDRAPWPGPEAPGKPASGQPTGTKAGPPRAEPHVRSEREEELTRAEVAAKVRERIAGRLSARALADWARGRFLAVERGQARYAAGDEAVLAAVLPTLTQAAAAEGGLSDRELVEIFNRLG